MNILATTRAARAATLASERQAALSLHRLYYHATVQVKDGIARFIHTMQVAANGNGGTVPHSFAKDTSIAKPIAHAMQQFGDGARVVVSAEQHAAMTRGAIMAQQQLQATVPHGYTWHFTQPAPAMQAQAKRVYTLFDKYGDEAATAATDAIRLGVLAGHNPVVIARDIQDALGGSLSNALMISRTEAMRSLRDATLANYRANDDVVDSWVWLASGNACFPKGTIINTRRGQVAIEDIRPGDEVLTHRGRYRRVRHAMKRVYQGDMVTVKLDNQTVTATSNHPFLIERQGDLYWMEASHIRLGDRVICDTQRSSDIGHHVAVDGAIEGCVGNANDNIPFALHCQGFSRVAFGYPWFAMPVCAVNFQDNIERWQKEINGRWPALNRALLSIFDAHRFQAQAGVLFGFGFPSELAIAPHATEAPSGSSWPNSKCLPTFQTGKGEHWSSAFIRAMLSIFPGRPKNLSTALTCTQGIRLLLPTTERTIWIGGRVDTHHPATLGARLGVSAGSHNTLARTIDLLGTTRCYTKRLTAMGADLLLRWQCNTTALGVWVCMLKSGITGSRTESTAAPTHPGIRDVEFNAALLTDVFHTQSISHIVTHTQKQVTVCNLEIEEDHTYVANGFVVHNCAMCLAMSGSEHSLDEDMESHNNCACTQVPKTKSWADILGSVGIDAGDIPETSVDIPSGESVFADKTEAQQRDTLGNAKYNAWKAGAFQLSDLVGTAHNSVWGASRYEKSLKDMGLDASDYSD